MTKKQPAKALHADPKALRPIVPPTQPLVAEEADRQDVYDSSIAEFELDGVKDAESGDHDPERNFHKTPAPERAAPHPESPKR